MRVGEDVATVLPWEAHTRTLGAQLVLPRVPTDLVPRAALLPRLEAGLGGKLTLIAAPAGYGKTTLLSALLRPTSRPAAYLALDEYGADGATFTAALVRALQTLAPDFGGDTLTLLRLPALPPKGYLAATLATEIAHLPEDAVLVLDDYHTLNSPDVDELLTALLRHLPPGYTSCWPLARSPRSQSRNCARAWSWRSCARRTCISTSTTRAPSWSNRSGRTWQRTFRHD